MFRLISVVLLSVSVGASIGGLTSTIKDVTIITWTLTANGSTDYVFSGDGFPTSQNDPDLYLVRGETYRFVNNTGGHPFRIQSTITVWRSELV